LRGSNNYCRELTPGQAILPACRALPFPGNDLE
jgi:hypothetical protein